MKRQLPNFVRAAAAGALLLLSAGTLKADEKLKVAFFGFELINTGHPQAGVPAGRGR